MRVRVLFLTEAAGEGLGSHSPNHDVEGGDCCVRGGRNEGPTCYTGKPHWGIAKKVCSVDQCSAHGRVERGQPGELHQKAILGCREGVWRRPVRGSAHGRVEGQSGEGASGGVKGPRTSGACGNACEGANDNGSVQGSGSAHGEASGGARVDCEEGRANQRVGVHDGGGASGCDDTLTGGNGGSLNGGDGRSQGGRSDTGCG
jgi:hypothetical protein